MPDPRFLAIITDTSQGPVLRRIEPYDYDRALRIENAGCTVRAMNEADLPLLRPLTASAPLTYRQVRRLAVLGRTRLDPMPPLVCVECSEDLEDSTVPYGDCVGCGWMVCGNCDAGAIPATGQSVCPAPECRANPDAADAEHTP
ncbi:hypothetical protein OG883_42560 [Streptomyces sp. NBC_01142]|uniref:hypothetical protein n=1 Tax=Streptomyces sp. NBC_01142 TaxID=2975865 RepID=UPI0022572CC5|nr:hypothetical protein [Streptomyces sp. NBC_01142]MCX4826326.1 hypothetical protein [Streptomyces sp. NBC_01142]